MNWSIPRTVTTAATLLLLGSTAFPSTAAETAAPQKGDLWEVTSKMSMEGMPMELPANKVKVCAPKEWTEPPGGSDERRKCTNSDFKVEGQKATWKVTCADGMRGEGEITRDGADHYSGGIKFTGGEATMNLKIDGRRLGECDVPK